MSCSYRIGHHTMMTHVHNRRTDPHIHNLGTEVIKWSAAQSDHLIGSRTGQEGSLYPVWEYNQEQQRFLLQILLLTQYVSGTTVPIIRSSRLLYSGCCLWYLVLWFSSCWSDVELRFICPVCRMLVNQHPANRTHNPQLHTRPAT